MSRSMSRGVLAAVFVCLTAIASMAQNITSQETKAFEVLAVDGNQLVVRLPEGTRELTVPADFRFTVNGQQMSVQQPSGHEGHGDHHDAYNGHASDRHQVKSGTVVVRSGSGIIVRTPRESKKFHAK